MIFSSSNPLLISAVASLFQDKIGDTSPGPGNVAVIQSMMLQFGKARIERTADFWMVRRSMRALTNETEPSNLPYWRLQHAGDFETLDLELQHSFPTFQFSTTDPDSEGFLLHLLRRLSMSTVESVRLMDVGPVPRYLDDDWKDVLASMVNVEELVLEYIADSAQRGTSHDAQMSSLFPCVASVVLEKRFFPQRHFGLPPYGTFRLEHLAECLVARQEPGGQALGLSMFSLESSVVTLGHGEELEAADVLKGIDVVSGNESGSDPGRDTALNKRPLSLLNRIAHAVRPLVDRP